MIWALPYALRPLPFALRVRTGGRLIGTLIRLVPPIRKRITRNLDLIFPQMSAADKRHLLKRISKNIGERFIETFFSTEFRRRANEFHTDPAALETLKTAHANGRAIIMVSGHFGQCETLREVTRNAGMESGVIYRQNSNPIFERHHYAAITAGGKPVFPTGSRGMRQMIKHLRSGGMVSVLLDQRQADGTLIEFMGKPALTSTAICEMAIKFNAMVVPVYGLMRPDGRHIDAIIEPEIPHTDALTMTTAIVDSLSARVRENPEQWYWLHQRWKIPTGQKTSE